MRSRHAVLWLALASVVSWFQPAYAQTNADIVRKLEQLNNELQALKQEKAQLQASNQELAQKLQAGAVSQPIQPPTADLVTAAAQSGSELVQVPVVPSIPALPATSQQVSYNEPPARPSVAPAQLPQVPPVLEPTQAPLPKLQPDAQAPLPKLQPEVQQAPLPKPMSVPIPEPRVIPPEPRTVPPEPYVIPPDTVPAPLADGGSVVPQSAGVVSSSGAIEDPSGKCIHIKTYVDYLQWRARSTASPSMGTITTSGTTQSINALDTQYGTNSGYRLGFAIAGPNGYDVRFTYTDYLNNSSAGLGDPAVDADNVHAALLDRSLANQTLGGHFDDGIVDAARESKRLLHKVFDVDVGYTFRPNDNLMLRPFVGMRFAHNVQNQSVNYFDTEAGVLSSAAVQNNTRLNATGFRGGLDFDRSFGQGGRCGDWGFSVFGNFGLSLLYGNFDLQRIDTTTAAGVVTTRSIHEQSDAMLPVLDLSVGAKVSYRRLSLAGGYEFSQWFNAARSLDVSGWDDNDGATSNYRVRQDNLSFSGWFLRAGLDF